MKNKSFISIISGLILALFILGAATVMAGPNATAPTLISYQGFLTDSNGDPMTGMVNLQFDLYATATGGSPLWSETQSGVPVSDGYFSVMLGSVTALSASDFSGSERWLKVTVNGTEMPRQQFASVPYALQAENAWALDGNGGTTNAVLGTTDAQTLTLVVNNTIAMRFNPGFDDMGPNIPNIIGGYEQNSVAAGVFGAVIGGGGGDDFGSPSPNQVTGSFGTVSGGKGNNANGAYATISGGGYNTTNGFNYPTVGGGYANIAGNSFATVAGGRENWAYGDYAFIGSGQSNQASGNYGAISGGQSNTISSSGENATIGGGHANNAGGSYATVSGGQYNGVGGNYATIGGGQSNGAIANYATIGGGQENLALSLNATIGGGDTNIITGTYAFIGGGSTNTIAVTGTYATIGGGYSNVISGTSATIGGGSRNTAANSGSAIGGGSNNTASNTYTTISGGANNTAPGYAATVGGGTNNHAGSVDGDRNAVIGGGDHNSITGGYDSTIGGGGYNQITVDHSTIGGGMSNLSKGQYGTIGGGRSNVISATNSTIPGGYRAQTTHYGEMAYASGGFDTAGDAQATTYVLRANVTNGNGTYSLYLDGSSESITIPNNRAMYFDIQVVGLSGTGYAAGYHFSGIAKRGASSTASFIGTPTKDTPFEDSIIAGNWDVNVSIDVATNALVIVMTDSGSSQDSRWVATVRATEVEF